LGPEQTAEVDLDKLTLQQHLKLLPYLAQQHLKLLPYLAHSCIVRATQLPMERRTNIYGVYQEDKSCLQRDAAALRCIPASLFEVHP